MDRITKKNNFLFIYFLAENNADDDKPLSEDDEIYFNFEEWISDEDIDEVKKKFANNIRKPIKLKNNNFESPNNETKHETPIEIIDIDDDNQDFANDDLDNFATCSICLRKFKSIELMKIHENYKHNFKEEVEPKQKTNFHCTICNQYFLSKKKWKFHNYYRHSNRNKALYRCRLCTDEFRTTTIRVAHERAQHQNPVTLRYDCLICDESFPQTITLQGHINIHNGVKPYICDHCGRSFTMETYLKTHLALHKDEKPFNCDKCSLRFRYKSLLKKHEQTHVNPRNRVLNKCVECVKEYADIRDLRRHCLKQHSRDDNVEKFNCNEKLCKFEAYQISDLKRHLRTIHKIYQHQ